MFKVLLSKYGERVGVKPSTHAFLPKEVRESALLSADDKGAIFVWKIRNFTGTKPWPRDKEEWRARLLSVQHTDRLDRHGNKMVYLNVMLVERVEEETPPTFDRDHNEWSLGVVSGRRMVRSKVVRVTIEHVAYTVGDQVCSGEIHRDQSGQVFTIRYFRVGKPVDRYLHEKKETMGHLFRGDPKKFLPPPPPEDAVRI